MPRDIWSRRGPSPEKRIVPVVKDNGLGRMGSRLSSEGVDAEERRTRLRKPGLTGVLVIQEYVQNQRLG